MGGLGARARLASGLLPGFAGLGVAVGAGCESSCPWVRGSVGPWVRGSVGVVGVDQAIKGH